MATTPDPTTKKTDTPKSDNRPREPPLSPPAFHARDLFE